MSHDQIERETLIKAPAERVWAVLTEPAEIDGWFSPGGPSEVDLRPGGIMTLNHGQYGAFPMLIVTVDPPRHFAYRWASAYPGEPATEDNSTLVQFFLEPAPEGTRLRLVESGFADLDIPAERVAAAGYDSHAGGWTEMVNVLREHAEK
jgi:uncharacterized protein YndB with AHSA1/START domain